MRSRFVWFIFQYIRSYSQNQSYCLLSLLSCFCYHYSFCFYFRQRWIKDFMGRHGQIQGMRLRAEFNFIILQVANVFDYPSTTGLCFLHFYSDLLMHSKPGGSASILIRTTLALTPNNTGILPQQLSYTVRSLVLTLTVQKIVKLSSTFSVIRWADRFQLTCPFNATFCLSISLTTHEQSTVQFLFFLMRNKACKGSPYEDTLFCILAQLHLFLTTQITKQLLCNCRHYFTIAGGSTLVVVLAQIFLLSYCLSQNISWLTMQSAEITIGLRQSKAGSWFQNIIFILSLFLSKSCQLLFISVFLTTFFLTVTLAVFDVRRFLSKKKLFFFMSFALKMATLDLVIVWQVGGRWV